MKKLLMLLLMIIPMFIMAQETEVKEASMVEMILGEGVSVKMFLVFYVMGIFGLVASIVFDIYSSGIDHKEFSLKIWWGDNKWRLLLSILVVAVGVIFSEQLIGIKLSPWAAFLTGFSSDKLIESLIQRRRRKVTNGESLK